MNMFRIAGIGLGATLFFLQCTSTPHSQYPQLQSQGVQPDSVLPASPTGRTLAVFGPNFTQRFSKLNPDSTYIFNFWATWCIPCIQELPEFKAYASQAQQEKLYMEFVSLDFPEAMQGPLQKFTDSILPQSAVSVLFAPDMNAWIPQVDANWEGAIPATRVSKGQKVVFHAGKLNLNQIDSLVRLVQN